MDLLHDQTDLSYVKHDFLGPIWLKKWKIFRKHNQQWMILCFLGYLSLSIWKYFKNGFDLFHDQNGPIYGPNDVLVQVLLEKSMTKNEQ